MNLNFSSEPGDCPPLPPLALVSSTASDPTDRSAFSSRLFQPRTASPLEQGPSSAHRDARARAAAPAITGWAGLTPMAMVEKIVAMAGITSDVAPLRSLTCSDGQAGQKRKWDAVDDEGGADADAAAEGLVAHWVAHHGGTPRPSPPVTVRPWAPAFAPGAIPSAVWEWEWERAAAAADADAWSTPRPSYLRVQCAFLMRAAPGGPRWRAAVAAAYAPVVKGGGAAPPPAPAAAPSTTPSLLPKQDDFNLHMQSWLKAHWQNPFPDEVSLRHLAARLVERGCVKRNKKDAQRSPPEGIGPEEEEHWLASEKAATWLVNARTRAWRPSLARAFDLQRPAALLFEDSLALYEGRTPRPLVCWDGAALFSADTRYAAPLGMRARRKSARGSGRSVADGAGGNWAETAPDDGADPPPSPEFDWNNPIGAEDYLELIAGVEGLDYASVAI